VRKTLLLRLMTPYTLVKEGQVESVSLPGEAGEFGVLPGHTKFITTLTPGILRYVEGGQAVQVALSGGFAEVHEGGDLTVLADSLEKADQLDVVRARLARDQAAEALRKRAELDAKELRRWEVRLLRAENRLRLAKLEGLDG